MRRFSFGAWLTAGLVGAVGFWLFQVLTAPSTIVEFMGQQIVSQGGYSQTLTVWIGWGVHIGVSLVYSLLFAIIVRIPFFSTALGRFIASLIIAVVLGWVTTLLTTPVISITISLLSGRGFPSNIPPLNMAADLPIWNHLLFFFLVWLVYMVLFKPARRERVL